MYIFFFKLELNILNCIYAYRVALIYVVKIALCLTLTFLYAIYNKYILLTPLFKQIRLIYANSDCTPCLRVTEVVILFPGRQLILAI